MRGFLHVQGVPTFSSLAQLVVGVQIDLRLDDRVFNMLNFLLGRPDFPQENRLTISIVGNWLRLEVNVHSARNGKGDHKWGRGEEVSLSEGVNSAFEVSVSTED